MHKNRKVVLLSKNKPLQEKSKQKLKHLSKLENLHFLQKCSVTTKTSLLKAAEAKLKIFIGQKNKNKTRKQLTFARQKKKPVEKQKKICLKKC